jgi:hypothetical protein
VEQPPALSTDDVQQAMRQHIRSIKQDVALLWFNEALADN